jgi:hypothetical protein
MKEKLTVSNFRDVTEISGVLKVLVFDKREFLQPVRQEMRIRPESHQGELVIKTGKIVFERGLKIHLDIYSDYARRSLFNGNVPKEYMSLRESRYGDESVVVIDLDRLMHDTLRRGERVEVRATLSLNGKNLTLLNHRRVPQLEQTTSSTVSIR